MSYWYHPELEKRTVGVLMDYNRRNPEARWRVEFTEGDVYICDYLTDYASDNSGSLDVEDVSNDSRYDEFYEVGFIVTEVVKAGPRLPGPREYIGVNYWDFPTRITNADTGEVIYEAPKDDGR